MDRSSISNFFLVRCYCWKYYTMVDDVVLLYGKTKLPANDCKVVFKDKFKKEHVIEISRLIQVFNNNIWNHKRSVK